MARRQLQNVLAVLICACAVTGVAYAQAPIVYASRAAETPVQSASVEGALAGGDDNSYGYGAASTRQPAAVIDVRRSNRTPVTEAVRTSAAAEAPRTETEAPAWLERERVGPPYEANGRWYVPTPEPGYSETGTASWYGPTFHGQATASGEVFDQEALTAAHPTLPIPSLVQVTNLENGREVIVRVNDRGPFVGERLIDLSRRSAEVLGFEQAGQARVNVRYLGPAPRRVSAEGAAPPAPQTAVAQTGPTSLLPALADESPLAGGPAYEPSRQSAAQAPAYSSAGAFYVQVGAFSDLTNAHRVRDAVSAAGPVNVDVRQTASGGELFRVRVGPWASREEADAARRHLVSLGYGETIVAAR